MLDFDVGGATFKVQGARCKVHVASGKKEASRGYGPLR